MAVNLAADDAAECRAAECRTGVAADQVAGHAADYRAGGGVALGLRQTVARAEGGGQGDEGRRFSRITVSYVLLGSSWEEKRHCVC